MSGLTSEQGGEGGAAPPGERWRLRVEGMDCVDCAFQLEQAIGQLPGGFRQRAHDARSRSCPR